MSADSNREPPQERPHVERAEELLSRLGQRFAQSRTQFSQALEQRAARTNGAGAAGAAPDTRPATERAEEMLDRAGERVGAFASNASYQVRRWLALAREGAEDIWAEAHSVSQRTEAEVRGAGRETVPPAANGADPARKAAPRRAARARTATSASAAAATKRAASTTAKTATAAKTPKAPAAGRARGTSGTRKTTKSTD